ncbi:Fibroblast growth factor receptor 1 [Hondaea fermentalgiana]|uniref:Fibroblast growth factor receptor 1 n=1 Tax=Hondaea fermentalgiana TaxID=2315210 RepID=A0A2R5H2R0_9STRA|nr:Fibroblast growth factor receptor 1 [Hondaea fermentalgiana]|eukprot:GBG35131.1 Fibroblast growth factor receptor 1 [Hondaea fermentalgiana]
MHVDKDFEVERSRSSSTTRTPVDARPQLIEKWDLGTIYDLGNGKVDRGEFNYLNEIITHLQNHIGNARILPYCNAYTTGDETYIGSSEPLVAKSFHGLDQAMREALRVAGVPGGDRLYYGVLSAVDPRSDTSRSPDFEYYMPPPGQVATRANVSSDMCIIVGELKTTKSLDVKTHEQLVELVKNRGSKISYDKSYGAVECPVTQLCNYMDIKHCKYGILTNQVVTFFVKKVSPTTVQITESFVTITAKGREALEAQSKKGNERNDAFETGNVAMADKYDGDVLPPLSLLQATSIFVAIAMKDFLDREKESSGNRGIKVVAGRGGEANVKTRHASSQGDNAKSSNSDSGRLGSRRTRSQDPNAADTDGSLANVETASSALFSGQVEIDIDTAQHLLTPVLFSVGAGYKSVSVKCLATGEVEPHCFAKALPLHLDMANSKRGDAERAARQAIDNEAKLLLGRAAPLQGKVLPRVVFFGTTTDGLESTYLVTRHEGESLSSRDGAQRALQVGLGEIRRRLHELLSMLHEAGLAHGDVALRNIVINDDNVLHFIDIGMAREDPSRQDMEDEHAALDRALDDLEDRAVEDGNVEVVGSASASVSEPEVTANENRMEDGFGVAGAAATDRSAPALERAASAHGNVRKSLRRLSLQALRSRTTTTVPTGTASDAHESTMDTSD